MNTRPLRPAPDVLFTRLNEEAVLLHLETKQYFSLNETGALIWQCLHERCSLVETAARLAQAYDVDEDAARRCVERFVATLAQDDLLVEEHVPA